MADIIIDEIDVNEQRRIQSRIEQERKDREFAERLYREQFENDSPRRPAATAVRGQRTPRGRGARTNQGTRARGATATRGTRRTAATAARPTAGSSSNGGGPVRRGRGTAAARASRGGPTSTRGRQSTRRRRTDSENPFHFVGDRLQARNGNEVIDVTAQAYFPESDDDSDYEESDGGDADEDHVIVLSSSAPSSDSDSGAEDDNRHAIPPAYIRQLLNPILHRDIPRLDPTYPVRMQVLTSSDESDGDDERDSDDDDIFIGGAGAIHAEQNHIDQPLIGNDGMMYSRELDLYHDDDEYQVPPAIVPKHKGKPVAPDSTWGDCTMCSEPPIKPQGCKKCLQFLGCADCVRRWHAARQSSYERPNCPLCRAQWNNHTPGVLMMPTIEKHRLKNSSNPSTSSSQPSTSSAP